MTDDEGTYAELDAEEVAPDLPAYRVIDVREAHEFHGPLGRIAGAELVPRSAVGDLTADPLDDRPLLVVCRSGRRSGDACGRLEAMGFRRPTNLAGGMIGWNRAGLPVERTSPACPGSLAESVVAWSAQMNGRAIAVEREQLAERLRTNASGLEDPDLDSVAELITLVESTLGAKPPADFDLAIGQFRRSLARL